MPSWLSKVFSLDRDPIIERLMKDPTLFNSMKLCSQNLDSIPKSEDFQKLVIQIAEKIPILLQGITIHQISKNSSELITLSQFVLPLLATAQITSPDDAGIVSLLTTLHFIFQIVPSFPTLSEYSHSLIHFCTVQALYPQLGPIINELEQLMLLDKQFCVSLCKENYSEQLINELFTIPHANDAIYMLYKNILSISDNFEPEIDIGFMNIIPLFLNSFLQKSIQQENAPDATLLITILIYINSKKIDILSKVDINTFLDNIYMNLVEIDQAKLSEFFYLLSRISFNSLNTSVILYIQNKMMINPPTENSILTMMKTLQLLISDTKIKISDIDQYFPIISVLTPTKFFGSRIQEEINQIFIRLADIKYSDIKSCLKPVFSNLKKCNSSSIQILKKISEMLDNKTITINDLNESDFIQTFVSNNDVFRNFSVQSPEFINILRLCYSKLTDTNIQWTVFSELISLEPDIHHSTKFSQLCSSFLVINPNPKLFSSFMDFVLKNPKDTLISIFIAAFYESKETPPIFINSFGLEWINQMIESDKFPQHLFHVFLSSLLHHQAFEEVNTWIQSLPLSHPIFFLEKPLLYHIVFGSNALQLRVPALLPLLPSPNLKLSPFSIYDASKSAMSEFIRHGVDLDDNKLVSKMANRYLTSDQFLYLLNNSKKLTNFCDITSDPFELFEFAPTSRNSGFTVSMNFTAVSFWFKLESEVTNQLNIFTTDFVKIYIKDKFLILQVNNSKTKIEIKKKSWELLNLFPNEEFTKINLELSSKKCSLDIKFPFVPFTSATFGSFDNLTNTRWFLSTVKFFENLTQFISYQESISNENNTPTFMNSLSKNNEILKHDINILNKGENFNICHSLCDKYSDDYFMNLRTKSDTEFSILSPFSYISNKGDGVLSVPYFGFSWFFTIKYNLVCALEIILKSDNKQKISEIIQAIINSYLITKNIPDFWLEMKMIIKEKVDVIENSILEYLFDLFFSSVEDLYHFNYIALDIDIWYLYGEKILNSIMKNLEASNFKFLPKMEYLGSILSTLFITFNNDILYMKYLMKFADFFNDIVLYSHLYHLLIISSDEVKISVLTMLIEYHKTHKMDMFAEVFTFKNVLDLLSVSSIEITSKLLELIVYISKGRMTYVSASISFSLSLMQCITEHSIWTKLLSIATNQIVDDFDTYPIVKFEAQKIYNPNVLITLVILICCSLSILTIVHHENNSETIINFEKDLKDVIRVLSYCAKFDSSFLSNNSIHDLLLFFTPLIFDATKLFTSNRFSVLQNDNDEKIKNIDFSDVYTIFDRLDIMNDIEESIPQTEDATQLIVSPFISYLLPVISVFRPDIKFPIENITKIPKFLTDHVNMITDFFTSFLVSAINNPSKFTTIFRVIVFDSPIKNMEGYSDFISKFICSLLTRPQVINAPIKSLNYLFSTVCIGLEEHSIGDKPGLLISSCLTMMKAIFSVKTKDTKQLIICLRHIISSMFSNCTVDEILCIFEILHSMKDFVTQINLFDDISFTSGFLICSTNINAVNDKRFIMFYNHFIDKIIFNDKFQHSWEKSFDSVSLLNLNKYVHGILNYVNKGGLSFSDWIRDNNDIYIQTTKVLEQKHREFNESREGIEFISTEKIDEHFFALRICSMTDSMNKRFVRLKTTINREQSIIQTLITYQKCFMQKHNEMTTYNYFVNNEICFMQNQIFDKSFRISPLTLPMMTPKLLIPSPFDIPKVEDHNIIINKNETKIIYKHKEFVDLFNREYTMIYNNTGMNIFPTSYSSVFDDNKMIYHSLIDVLELMYGEVLETFNVLFMKYSEGIKSVVLEFKDVFCCLIGSEKKSENEIEIKSDSYSKIIHENLIEMSTLGLFGHTTLFCGHPVIIIPYKSIIFTTQHYYAHKKVSLRINTFEGGEIILIPYPVTSSLPQQFIKFVEVVNKQNDTIIHTLSIERAKHLWLNHKMSNYDYLLFINSVSGRSFSDLSQYPVFPWLIDDYKSDQIPVNMRDLSKPMGQLDETRSQLYDSFYESQKTHFYTALYSMSSCVHYYLVRQIPFTYFEWDLHDGWDESDRMFKDLFTSFDSCSREDTNDLRELIPEFFCFSDFLIDVNNMNINNVTIPKYCKNSFSFVSLNYQFLEKSKIENWIDLIFGCDQQGQNSIIKKNMYNPVFYHNYQMQEEETIESLIIRLSNWGQCPSQIFKKKHPHRNTNETDSDETINNINDISNMNKENINFNSNNENENQIDLDLLMNDHNASYFFYDNQNIFCKIDTNKGCIDIFNFVSYDKNFIFSRSIRSSQNGLFFVVDFSFGVSQVFALMNIENRDNREDRDFIRLREIGRPFETFNGCRTSINGNDMICSSVFPNKKEQSNTCVVLWDFVRGVIHRRIEIENFVVDTGFDDCKSILYVLTKNDLHVYSDNSMLLSKINLERQGLCLEVPKQMSFDEVRPVFVGSSSGDVYAFNFDPVDVSIRHIMTFKLNGPPIREIIFLRTSMSLYIKDESGKISTQKNSILFNMK